MPNDPIITNARLLELIQKSFTIQNLDPEARNALLAKIAQLPEAGQQEMIVLLEEEAAAVASGKILSSEAQQEKMKAGIQKLIAVKKDLDKAIRVESEQIDVKESNRIAEQLLQQL